MAEYDTSDYKMKKAALEIAKLQVLTSILTTLMDWDRLIREKDIEPSEYPALFTYFNQLVRGFSDGKSYESAFNNPLADLAIMYGTKDPEIPPCEKSE